MDAALPVVSGTAHHRLIVSRVPGMSGLGRRIGSLIAVLLVVTACGADPSDEDGDPGETATTATTTAPSTTPGGLYGGDD